jgi:superfamily II DNA or RNA helicase
MDSIEFSPGMRIIVRDEEWTVKKVESNTLGSQSLHCVGISPLVKDKKSIFITELESIDLVNPAATKLVADDSPFFRKSRLYVESQWRQQIPTDSDLHIGDKAAMDPMNYQLEPVALALTRPRQRILIADTVGLGKTLEAGILVSELMMRGKGKRILVVTVKSMMLQFQKEFWNRFTIPLVRLDSGNIQKVRAKLPANHNPFFYYDKTIISIDTLKRDVEYRTHLENATWDIIIIDEAHNVADRGNNQSQSQRARLAKLLAGRSDTLILLSATPHDGRSESFASLMNMLDPTAIADIHNYTKDDIQGLCIRRFKKDIQSEVRGAFKERRVSTLQCQASQAEERAYSIFADMTLEMDTAAHHLTGTLFKTSLEKSLFSSPTACIKSIEERLKKLGKKYAGDEIGDIAKLRELKSVLEQIGTGSFSRYTRLLELMKSPEYSWSADKSDDRIVIFTERIETMRFLAAQLRKDLRLPGTAVSEMYGGMSDAEQQQIVEDFGREESPIRILVASDVASEGINLHYLCHRLIHFDIPWSLMVFQQRNGRIDRYGQREQPDIRYFLINSNNPDIHGDTRILKILISKEEQAYKNIGDPALLMGLFNVESEELFTAAAIESNTDATAFEQNIDNANEEFDPFELLMSGSADSHSQPTVHHDETLFRDIDYLKTAVTYFAQSDRHPIHDLQTVEGVEIEITPDLQRRLDVVLPDEIKPRENYLQLSPDKSFCMSEMRRSLQNSMSETAWPTVQYLWPLHPIFEWINDKAGLLFKRNETPLIGVTGTLPTADCVFIVAGTIPNRKSTPVVDEWFGLQFSGGKYIKSLAMEKVIATTGYGRTDMPNRNNIPAAIASAAQSLVPTAVAQARIIMSEHCAEYRARIDPKLNEELDKLIELQGRHKETIEQLSLFERQKSEKEREVDRIFEEFTDWVKDTLEIEDVPYLRIIAAIVGV